MIVRGEHIRAAAGPAALVLVTTLAISSAFGAGRGIENLNVKPSSSTSRSVAGHGSITSTEFLKAICDPTFANTMTEEMTSGTTGYTYILDKQISYPAGGAKAKLTAAYITDLCQPAGNIAKTVNPEALLHSASMTSEELSKLPDSAFRIIITLPGAYEAKTRLDPSKDIDFSYIPDFVQNAQTSVQSLGAAAKQAVDKITNTNSASEKNAPYIENEAKALTFLQKKAGADSSNTCAKTLVAASAFVEQRNQSTAESASADYNSYTGANTTSRDVRVKAPEKIVITSEYPAEYGADVSVPFGGSANQPQGLYAVKTVNAKATCEIAPGAIDPSKTSGASSSAPSAAATTPGGR